VLALYKLLADDARNIWFFDLAFLLLLYVCKGLKEEIMGKISK
jgi:hypothetical protein